MCKHWKPGLSLPSLGPGNKEYIDMALIGILSIYPSAAANKIYAAHIMSLL